MPRINCLTEQPDNVPTASAHWGKSFERDAMHGPVGFRSHGKHIRSLRSQELEQRFEDEPDDALLPECDLYCAALKELNSYD